MSKLLERAKNSKRAANDIFDFVGSSEAFLLNALTHGVTFEEFRYLAKVDTGEGGKARLSKKQNDALRAYYEENVIARTSSKRRRPVDWEKLDGLAEIHCTCEEAEVVMKMGPEKMQKEIRNIFGTTVAEYLAKQANGGKAALRRRQFQTAMGGDAQMQKFLGKNWLGQKDKFETESTLNATIRPEVVAQLKNLSKEELLQYEALRAKMIADASEAGE